VVSCRADQLLSATGWRNKDDGVWQIREGHIEPGEDAEATARREAREKPGIAIDGSLFPLGESRQKGGKIVEAFGVEGDVGTIAVRSTMFEMEWPPKSGRMRSFPEVDAARWFGIADVRSMVLESQRPLLDRLVAG
jgi:predicted NUDIX family NTP pyrophosphohydrolase